VLRHGRYTISVERQGAREWFRLRLGTSVLADRVWTVADLERELARYGLTLADFGDGEPTE
jgi:hypothetical protein